MEFINDKLTYSKFLEWQESQANKGQTFPRTIRDFDTTDKYPLLSWHEFAEALDGKEVINEVLEKLHNRTDEEKEHDRLDNYLATREIKIIENTSIRGE